MGASEQHRRNSEVEDAIKLQRGFHGCKHMSKPTQLYTSNICTLYYLSKSTSFGEEEGREEESEGGICFFKKGPESRFLYFFSRKTE